MFSVADEEEARALLTLSCGTNSRGEFVADMLARHQNLENLEGFAALLEERHGLLVKHGRCRCEKTKCKSLRTKA